MGWGCYCLNEFLCVFSFSDLGIDGIFEFRIEIAIIEALGMMKWCVDCFMNMMCRKVLKIVL